MIAGESTRRSVVATSATRADRVVLIHPDNSPASSSLSPPLPTVSELLSAPPSASELALSLPSSADAPSAFGSFGGSATCGQLPRRHMAACVTRLVRALSRAPRRRYAGCTLLKRR